MIKIISFDVGIKNLAYCVVSFNNSLDVYDHTIEDWGVIDIMEKFLDEAVKCSVNKKGVLCGCPAVSAVNITRGYSTPSTSIVSFAFTVDLVMNTSSFDISLNATNL